MLDLKEFRDIPGYEGLYAIDINGNVLGIKYNKIRKSQTNAKGYRHILLSKNNKHFNTFIHRLVALTFIPNPLLKPAVNHKDGNKLNNKVSNLEWVTYKENTQHGWDTGLLPKRFGKDHHASRKIFDTVTGENFDSISDAARKTGIGRSSISNNVCGQRLTCSGRNFQYLGDAHA